MTTYIGNPPKSVYGVKEATNVVYDHICDGVESELLIDLSDWLDTDVFDIAISTAGSAGCHYIYYGVNSTAYSDPQTIASTFTGSITTVWNDVAGYVMVGDEHVSARAQGTFHRTGTGTGRALQYEGLYTRWSSGQAYTTVSSISSTAETVDITQLRLQHKQKTGLTVAAFPAGTRVTLTAREATNLILPLEYVAPRHNYVINSDFAINQRAYVDGATVPLYGAGYDRWLGLTGSDTHSVSGRTATITGQIYQKIEDCFQVGDKITLSWRGTSAVSLGAPEFTQTSSGITDKGINYSTGTISATGHIVLIAAAGTLKDVKVEMGDSVSPYEVPDHAPELVRCQRYYEESGAVITLHSYNTTIMDAVIEFKVVKATTPTVYVTRVNFTSAGIQTDANGFRDLGTYALSATSRYISKWTATAEI